jgi:hypothetical protein
MYCIEILEIVLSADHQLVHVIYEVQDTILYICAVLIKQGDAILGLWLRRAQASDRCRIVDIGANTVTDTTVTPPTANELAAELLALEVHRIIPQLIVPLGLLGR